MIIVLRISVDNTENNYHAPDYLCIIVLLIPAPSHRGCEAQLRVYVLLLRPAEPQLDAGREDGGGGPAAAELARPPVPHRGLHPHPQPGHGAAPGRGSYQRIQGEIEFPKSIELK